MAKKKAKRKVPVVKAKVTNPRLKKNRHQVRMSLGTHVWEVWALNSWGANIYKGTAATFDDAVELSRQFQICPVIVEIDIPPMAY